MALYRINNLSFTYPSGEKAAIQDVKLEIEQGEFVLFLGESGSGKTTLLRHLKKDIMPNGSRDGMIYYKGKNIVALTDLDSVCETGMVFQDLESQLVMDTVINEICFSMENIALDRDKMMRRLAEITAFFGIEGLLDKQVHELSGGQKQMVNICGVLALKPDVMILDEPISQLDPMATKDLINMIGQLNSELDITIIMSSHILDDVIHLVDRIIYMKDGSILYDLHRDTFIKTIMQQEDNPIKDYIPESIQLLFKVNRNIEDIAYTIKGIRNALKEHPSLKSQGYELVKERNLRKEDSIISLKKISYAYDIYERLVLADIDFDIYHSDFICILGSNGSGKTTLLKILGGLIKPQKGYIKLQGIKITRAKTHLLDASVGYVAQNSLLHFTAETVREELDKLCNDGFEKNTYVASLVERLQLNGVLNHHPYDLSGGQQQKLTIIMALAKGPKILLLDEPTKGLDPLSKAELANILVELNSKGITIVMVSHDLDFVARYAKRVVMLFNKSKVYDGNPREFFMDNNYFTTRINQAMKTINPDWILLEDVCL